jgi:D-alanine-D-alanine ligase
MNDKNLAIGIVFNVYDPGSRRRREGISEDTVEHTANEVLQAVTSIGHTATLLPLQDSFTYFLRRIQELKLDSLVNLVEGFNSCPQYEGNVAGAFELMRIPFTGNNSKTLGLCQDKYKTKVVLRAYGLLTAQAMLVMSPDQAMDMEFPLIIKPNHEDASLGITSESVVFDKESLVRQVEKVISAYNQPVIVEKYIEGREFNVAVIDSEKVQPLPVSEIDFSGMPEAQPHIVSYEAKWNQDHILYISTPPICPAQIDDSLKDRLQQTALSAFKVMGCRDYARIDMRMDKQGRVYILEVNPNPDISLGAGYARALRAAGIDYAEFWQRMITNALRRKTENGSVNGKVG